MHVRPAGTGTDPCQEVAATGEDLPAEVVTATVRRVGGPRRARGADWLRCHRTTITAHAVVVLVTIFVIRVVGSGFGAAYPPYFPDSSSFAAVARRGPFSGRFWFDERPIGFPLLFWGVGRSVRFVVLVQIALYVAAFGAVVAVALRTMRSRLARAVVSVFVIALALQPRFAMWTTHVLSESSAITTGIAAVAAWWWFAARPTRRRALAALVVSGAFVLVRDSNVVVFACSVIPTLAAAGWRWRRSNPDVGRTLLAGAAVGVVLCGYVTVSQDVADRNIYPVINNVGERILPDADMTAWFAARGMPLDDALRDHRGDDSFDDDSAMLEEPELEDFRAWASGPGQRWQLISYLRHAPFWSGLLTDRLDELLHFDYAEYDGFGVGDRLVSPVLDGPRSSRQLALWLAVGGVGLLLAASRPRLRGQVVVVTLAVAGALLDIYVSFSGDSLEVQRHLVAPLARLSVSLVLAVGLGIEWFADRRRGADATLSGTTAAPAATDDVTDADGDADEPQPVTAGGRRSLGVTVVGLATTALATSIVLAAFFGNELRAKDYDPQFMKVLVDRVGALGVGYYQGALHNKGPFEPFVYRVAAFLTSNDGFWFAISAFVIVAAVICGLAVAVTARVAGTSWILGGAIGGGLFVHLTLTRADYSGVLYSRNMTIAMLATAWIIAVWSRPWCGSSRRRLVVVGTLGVLLGLCVQTLITSVFAATVVGLVALDRVRRDHPGELRRAVVVMAGTGAATIVAPVVWYAARGTLPEFWGGWWIYGSYQSAGLGRSLFTQFGLAWDQAYAYYREWPVSALVLVAAAGLAVLRWPQLPAAQRAMRLGIAAWWLAAWIELAFAQRYSSHYFSVLAVPTWLAAAALAGDLTALVPNRRVRPVWRAALPALVALAVMFSSTEGEYRNGVAAAADFTGVHDLALARRQQEGGTVRTVRATIDLVSRPGDTLLAWTEWPWTYLQWDRIAATRYVWGSFLLGEVYLGAAGPQFVPPHTAEWFADDLVRSDPAVFVEHVDDPVPPESLVGRVVAAAFTPVYTGPTERVYVRNELAAALRRPAAGATDWQPTEEPAEGWRLESDAVSSEAALDDQLLVTGTCRRLDGVIGGDGGAETRFVVDDTSSDTTAARGGRERQYLSVDGGSGWSSTDTVELERATFDRPRGPVPFSLLIGADSVALVVDGEVRAAVRTWGDVDVSVRAPAALSELAVSPLVLGDACPG